MSFNNGRLRYFVAVAEEGQITRAAAKLHIAQPALSQAIAQLEVELGITLFERTARGVTLTRSGAAFLPKAQAAVASEDDLAALGEGLKRSTAGIIEMGFVGPPPTMNAPELFDAFALAHPQAEVSFRDLPFPQGPTLSWLRDVDVAFCVPPEVEAGVSVQIVRTEPRAIVAHRSHPLAGRAEITVGEALSETFISYDPAVQARWTAFHSLDDHRGGPPLSVTIDHATSSLQMLGIMTTGRGVTTVPLSDARLAVHVMPDLVAIPVTDAAPAALSLIWAQSVDHPTVQALIGVARDLAADAGRRPPT